jgi:hypothetical protein
MPDFSIKLTENSDWIHSRTVGSMYGSRNLESLANKIGHSFWRKQEFPKHRYIYFLGSARENKKFRNDLKLSIVSYENIRPFTPLLQYIVVNDRQIQEIKVLQGEDMGWKVKRGEVYA